jgi:hypothetical protein
MTGSSRAPNRLEDLPGLNKVAAIGQVLESRYPAPPNLPSALVALVSRLDEPRDAAGHLPQGKCALLAIRSGPSDPTFN